MNSSLNHLYTDDDIAIDPLKGKTIAIIGYGNQGRPQALNLRDSRLIVIVGARENGTAYKQAQADQFEVFSLEEAIQKADVVMCLLPDDVVSSVYNSQLSPYFTGGQYLGFGHGLVIKENWIEPDKDLNVFMVAPKGQGRGVRSKYIEGKGVPGLFGVHQDPSSDTADIAKAYAKGIGCGRAAVVESSFEEEAICDLFSEQVVLCGGLTRLIAFAFETLVEAGYSPEAAYFECLFEVKLIADLLHDEGIAAMRDKISTTALFGDVSRGDRLIDDTVKASMKTILNEIESGKFASDMLKEVEAGQPNIKDTLEKNRDHLIEKTHHRLAPYLHGK